MERREIHRVHYIFSANSELEQTTMSLNKRNFFPSDFGTSEFSNWWNGIWGFSWFKNNEIAASGGPKDTRQLNWLKDQGIKHILCLDQLEMSVYNKYSMQVETLALNVKLIEMEEFKAPDSETIDKLLQYLTSVYQKKKVRTGIETFSYY